jgi:hypothetical protein
MTAQTTQQRPPTQTQELAVFDNRQAAEAAQNLLQQQADLSLSDIRIQGDINTYEEVAAMGTTVGPEAGLLIGAFSGGIVGVVFVAIYSTLAYGDLVNTPFNQLSIVAFTLAGAIFGIFTGNRIRNAQLPAQKQKGNSEVPRRFQLMVEGDAEALTQARECLGYPTAS